MQNRSNSLAIGVDLGATKIAAALVAPDGSVLLARQAPTNAEGGEWSVLNRIASQINALIDSAPEKILGIGIGTPGQVNSKEGIVRNAVNLGWGQVQLVDEIRARLSQDLPVWIQKDANASALGEYYFGAARGCPDFIYLSIGSGLGGGILSNGYLVTGANWNAAELGHLSLDPAGYLCTCGLRGCAETIVSGPGLATLVRDYISQSRFSTRIEPDDDLNPEAILEAAHAGDELAQKAFFEVGRQLGIVMAACTSALNPALFVIAGGLGLAAFDLIIPPAKQELERRVLPASYRDLQISPSSLTSSAVGAASLAWYFSDIRKHPLDKEPTTLSPGDIS
jgi:glucokinase